MDIDLISREENERPQTVAIQIINEEGKSLDGYLDKSRKLIFTKYGIVGVEALKAYSPRKYTIIEKEEA